MRANALTSDRIARALVLALGANVALIARACARNRVSNTQSQVKEADKCHLACRCHFLREKQSQRRFNPTVTTDQSRCL